MRKNIILCLISVIAVFAALSLNAAPPAVVVDFSGMPDSEGVPAGWELKTKNGTAVFKVVNAEDNEKTLYFKSVDSSFSMQHDLLLNSKEYPYLTWKWKAVKLPEGGDLRKGRTNDQALQTLIAFKGGNVISYVWDTTAPEGSTAEESVPWPISIKIKAVVIKSGTAQINQWVTFTRNIYTDYKRLFGEEPPKIKGIRVQINTQNTGTTAESYFGKMIFKTEPGN